MKNLRVYSISKSLKKKGIHDLIKSLSNELYFKILNLEINFISAKSILDINKTYLNHDYTTDIITFNYSEIVNELDGEIFISIDDALSNSKKFNVSVSDELVRLVIHGILHLLGYDDIAHSDKKIMKRMENKLLSKFKIVLL
ncbi:MAG TPA: rRNA maturation RNase YbeY [Ignavibacteriaceae bacterium]|nr:rRNA maturation RNase YbeY [Ignavibacterium sp.]HMN25323.1 rRNA maturation RNase YbeY [Ignavibacteriaceae bacterium]HRN25093.1 rRNA maturation RNase YbeY [Ignavibacteriaceae bacterium]HRP93872.1 rRNA maturation RNase YbeY [Ignavibacteriaceae bacterium]HRQ54325.1 rRNA maturation RNase YbeY [Ignavibacteriaceae bacterium]